ncbi:hypothetical protein SUGI_0995880 [Cryptomeria japonica]|uniref:chorismate mutase 1, chloroplastic n=1 Tax=Cryptomeria japonica TaxID=3369 RepID=UPI002414A42A|nr:chorismate mutase 1, chloroplastic [Cryptomeria japonica]XP_057849961.2 chorismate mutase 1, chloroplastic [Cryptomeria japonica]XP_057849962.2 chorismate mutase 1, chloroplastic [Cryptomeria japonica]GLJ47173.1 hypothetical protein SUGI_0995880 [Cryptomeria japonica]
MDIKQYVPSRVVSPASMPTKFGSKTGLKVSQGKGKWSSWASILTPSSKISPHMQLTRVSASSTFSVEKDRLDLSQNLTLDAIRSSLIRQEDSIIFNLLERAQYCFNAPAYDVNAFSMPGFSGSLIEYILRETEHLNAKVGRYKSPDEHPFFPQGLPEPLLPPLRYPQVLHPIAHSININESVWSMYFDSLLPRFAAKGDDGNYGSTAVCDTLCLQALSKRIHYGKFVAEAKFRASPEVYEVAIRAQDKDQLMNLLTFENVELAVQKRVEEKAKAYGQEVSLDVTKVNSTYKIQPSLIANLYGEWIMPLTKEVQVAYLLRRLD